MKKLISVISFFFLIVLLFVFKLPPRRITLKDITPVVTPATIPDKPAAPDNILIDTQKTLLEDKVQIDYYIIVESSRNPTMAKQKAEKLKNDFNRNFIVLPPTSQGYCRISCGNYSTLEEAKSAIESIKAKIRPDAWIFSVKK